MSDLSPSIRPAARRLRLVTLVSIVLVELVVLLALWAVLFGRRASLTALHIEDGGLTAWPTAIGLLLIGLFVGLALFRLARMLGRIEAGELFPAGDLRGFALYLFASVLVSILVPMVGPLLDAGPAPHRLALNLSLTEALMLLISGLLFFVARLLDAARAIADDNSQIV
jgi:hypothetical protein